MNKNIAFFVNSLNGGGAEKVLSLIANQLSKTNNIYILTLSCDRSIYDLSDNINIIHLNNKIYNNMTKYEKLFDFIKIPFLIKNILQENNINILISLLFRPHIINILTKSIYNIKIKSIIWEHSIQSKSQKKIGSFLIKKLYSKADNIIAVSNSCKQDLINNFKINEALIDVIYNPIEIDKINILKKEDIELDLQNKLQNKFIISFVGRFTKAKNLQLLINAVDKLKELDIIVLMIGDGEEREKFQLLINEKKLNDKFIFLGWQSNPYKYIYNSDCFVLPSLWESFGNVVIEALACDTQVITSDSFALKELNQITNNSTVLFKNNDINSLTDRINIMYKLNQTIKYIDFKLFDTKSISNDFLGI